VEITTAKNDTALNVGIIGRLDTTTAPQLECELNDKLEDITELVLDCSELEYISSAGLRVFLGLHKLMMEKGSLLVLHPNDTVMEIFQVTGFDGILNIEK
jgi:anti-sigma B factor antagonist